MKSNSCLQNGISSFIYWLNKAPGALNGANYFQDNPFFRINANLIVTGLIARTFYGHFVGLPSLIDAVMSGDSKHGRSNTLINPHKLKVFFSILTPINHFFSYINL